ncbi:MAG: zinc-binding alcohol dehydrogenase family protein [Acidobacteriaceae bacterium]|nr:zinc-binding alcohol dehydrogenase family protein [Acidobacteriaceae bacterium]
MNAAVLHTIGKPPRFEQFPEPSPLEGEVVVHVRAAALKPVDRAMANGSHYASFRELPVVCGLDGAGYLEDGTRVLFAGPRRPYGSMAQRTVVSRSRCFAIPDDVDDETAAALFNPGMSAWLSLAWRAQLAPGETVLILGATGITGRLAIQIARLLGAGRVIGAGRNVHTLSALRSLGADATIRLDQSEQDLAEAFAREAGSAGYNVIIDYLWGPPTEVLLASLTRTALTPASHRIRLVQAGESAGPTISLPAAVLRSSQLEILGAGSGNMPAPEVLANTLQELLARAASGELRIDTERVALVEIESAWARDQSGRRLLVIP